MRFVFPCKEYEQKAIDFIREFHDYSSPINGTGGLDSYLETGSYDDWLAKIMRYVDIANMPEGKVPEFTYFYVREEDVKIIGMISVRSALNDFLRKEGGNIGYCVRPAERGKGYGTQMLREALAFCPMIGLREVIITCDKINIASAGVIKNCGGILEDEFYSETFKEIVQRYLIKICQKG